MANTVSKKVSRLRRATKTRHQIRELKAPRLSVHRTPQHIYAQLILSQESGSIVLVAASSVEKELRAQKMIKTDLAAKVGTLIAERAKEKGIQKVAFDRSGFKYHGRIKALADAARAAGLEF